MLCFACGNYNFVLTCHIYTHTHTHTHTERERERERNAHKDLNFVIFWKDCKIKYTSNLDSAGPRNLIHRNSCFLMKTPDLRKFLGK